jgi:uncharacterized protein
MPGYQLEPDLPRGDVSAGDPAARNADRVLVGKLVEAGASRRLTLDISGEQVVAIFGKRGTGKSFTLGVLMEGLAAGNGQTAIAGLTTPRAGLVLDIMDIFWTSTIKLQKDGSDEIKRQFERMTRGGFESLPLSVDVWIPAGFESPEIDPPDTSSLRVQASDLGLDDWADLFGIDIFGEPRGMLLADLVAKVGTDGYTKSSGETVAARPEFSFNELVDCVQTSADLIRDYKDETRRSIRQRLSSYAALPLFAGVGTSLSELLRPFRVSVLMLARVPDELKKVLVAVLLKRILRERRDASFAQKRLDLDSRLQGEDRAHLQEFVRGSIPRTWVMLDEAHVLAGLGERSGASEALIKYAKEGRNYGLSMAVATQQPSALEPRLTSQAETLIIHQLTAPADAAVATQNIRSALPSRIRMGGEEVSVDLLIRRLTQGEMVFSCGNAPSLPRMCVAMVRPRVSAHGGYEA